MAKANESTYVMRMTFRRRPRDGLPVVANNASEKCRYEDGRKIMPIHVILNQVFTHAYPWETLVTASPTNTTTTQRKITATDRATLSRKLNESA